MAAIGIGVGVGGSGVGDGVGVAVGVAGPPPKGTPQDDSVRAVMRIMLARKCFIVEAVIGDDYT